MQFCLTTINKISTSCLWDAAQKEASYLLKPDSLFTHPFLPKRYMTIISEDVLKRGIGIMSLEALTQKIYWHKLTGGHLQLQSLFEVFDFNKSSCNVSIFGFRISALAGRGSTASVYITESGYVLKVVSKEFRQKLQNEFELLNKITCKNIVRSFDFFDSVNGSGLLLEKLSPAIGNSSGYFKALKYLHNIGICHGDIRYTNLGSGKDGCAKLFDLGNSFAGTEQIMQKEFADLTQLFKNSRK